MNTPRRRHSPAIYRRRRIALLILLVLIALVIWGITSCVTRGDDSASTNTNATESAAVPTATAAASPSASADASDSDDATSDDSPDADVATCAAGDLSVSVKTSASTYSFSQQPQFVYQVTNISSVACSANVGTTQQQLVVGSGQAEIWKLTPCIANPADAVEVLQPDEPVSGTVTWDLSFNDGTACTKTRQASTAGTYWVQASIGSVSSSQYAFVLQ
ncbi:hypothetical protein [Pseudoclavibacter soli]|uniref:hypothetical protein n=1 Tax=Pseudoclavibacter soli TaxID=452623 RepID=UPI000415EA8E|nr:hypothetical protein [Pseudoclavibacter soli]